MTLFCFLFLSSRMKKAYSRVYKIAIANFDSIPAISTCTLFIDLLGMDSRCMRVDVESANFILKNLKKKDDNRYDTAAKLKCFIGKILLTSFSFISFNLNADTNRSCLKSEITCCLKAEGKLW